MKGGKEDEDHRLEGTGIFAGDPALLILCEGIKGGKEGVFFTRPLIIYSSQSDMTQSGYTDEMNYIYTNGDFNGYYKKP